MVTHLRQSCGSRLPSTDADANPAAVHRDALARDPADRVDEHRPLGGLDPLVERLDVVVLGHLDRHLRDDRAGVDTGPIIAQVAVPVLPDDTEETLTERIKEAERRQLVESVGRLVREGWTITGRKVTIP